MERRVLIYNVKIVSSGQTPFMGRVLIEGNFIKAVEPDVTDTNVEAHLKINGNGALLLPGGIDEHVHFREPGMTSKATMASESRAAIEGGVTSWIDMPNTIPPTTSTALLDEKISIARQSSPANYGFYIGATSSNLEELAKSDYSHIAGIKLFIGATTGSLVLDDDEALDRLFSTAPSIIAVHAEDNAIIEANKQRLLKEYGDNDDLPIAMHPDVRSREACVAATRRAINLALKHNTRLHLMHISTADELELLKSLPADARITAETCPQYLLFSSDDYRRLGARIKCNPAIKEESDRLALIEAVRSGLIDTIATDHAPHLLSDKQGGALKAASGMPLIQFAMPLMLDIFGPEIVAEKMAAAPAKILNIKRRGLIAPGYYADLALFEPVQSAYTITDGDVVSKCRWTPVNGMKCRHRVMMTMVNGVIVKSLINGIDKETAKTNLLEYDN